MPDFTALGEEVRGEILLCWIRNKYLLRCNFTSESYLRIDSFLLFG